ncbi:hypothetical protein QBC44DRAFT_95185 [Cladorrhinum sp. PSN332]|nr:hypothetical protein QBC44DRAFT_95185 [Cladorrhinum sp. PSN332]
MLHFELHFVECPGMYRGHANVPFGNPGSTNHHPVQPRNFIHRASRVVHHWLLGLSGPLACAKRASDDLTALGLPKPSRPTIRRIYLAYRNESSRCGSRVVYRTSTASPWCAIQVANWIRSRAASLSTQSHNPSRDPHVPFWPFLEPPRKGRPITVHQSASAWLENRTRMRGSDATDSSSYLWKDSPICNASHAAVTSQICKLLMRPRPWLGNLNGLLSKRCSQYSV